MAEPAVINASPLIHLARAGFLDLLQILDRSCLVPVPVLDEIQQRGPQDATVLGIAARPWLQPVQVSPAPIAITEWDLGKGESSVLTYALSNPGCLVVIDDLAARRCAEVLSIPLIGTLGTVLRARHARVIPAAAPVLARLLSTGMYLGERILRESLSLLGEDWVTPEADA